MSFLINTTQRTSCSELLAGVGITVLAYTDSFTLYTYISAILLQVTKVSVTTASLLMPTYGIMAAVGNIGGDRLTDRRGADQTVMVILIGLTLVLFTIWLLADKLIPMVVLIGLLGALTYAIVPALQTRVIKLSHLYAPHAPSIVAGLNIVGFNLGIAQGSLLGGVTLETLSLTSTAWVGAIAIMLGALWLSIQMKLSSASLKKLLISHL